LFHARNQEIKIMSQTTEKTVVDSAKNTSMKRPLRRQSFLKQGSVLGGGLLLLGRQAQTSRAADNETNPADGAASAANETIKTIRN
jgi:hypothetical protein